MRTPRWTRARSRDLIILAILTYIIVWALHPSLIFSNTLLTGGDTGSHLALPAFMRSTGDLFNFTPWYPGWFAGMPAYSYYFALPDVVAVYLSYLVGFAHAFKFVTILGSVLMAPAAYLMGRLFRAPRPIPVGLAVATLPFLFDASFTIDGGNLFSTMAGEYAFSLSLALALVTIGLFARGVREARGYWLTAGSLSLTLMAHILPWFFVLASAGVLGSAELLRRSRLGRRVARAERIDDVARPVRFVVGAGLLSAGLSAWWLWPFATTQSLTNSMGYVNDPTSSWSAVGRTLGWFNASGGAAGDRWVLIGAALATVAALVWRDRLGLFLAAMAVASAVAFLTIPQGVLWNERLVPFWFLTTHLLCGWLLAAVVAKWLARKNHGVEACDIEAGAREIFHAALLDGSRDPEDEVDVFMDRAERSERRGLRRLSRATWFVAAVGILSVVPGQLTGVAQAIGLSTSGNQVSSWAQWNYSGYQAMSGWPEYHALMNTMARVGTEYGCGRAMWEYNSDENRFGTPEALMLMPYWTNNCIGSMEGLFFESSATTPYHFLDQAELSVSPSDPQVGLDYGTLNVAEGISHLRELGVRYYVAYSPAIVSAARQVPGLRQIATSHATSPGAVTWHVYEISSSALVAPLRYQPNVVANASSRVQWLAQNQTWWLTPSDANVLLAAQGPRAWPRITSVGQLRTGAPLAHDEVTDIVSGPSSITFHVSRVGVPVVVKISYYPRWHATGATGPYRVSPNLMVVIPTSHVVSLTYGTSPAVRDGNYLTDATVLVGVLWWWRQRQWRRRRRR